MPAIAYMANQFPSEVEPYVGEEILELRQRGVEVIACSARQPEKVMDIEMRRLAQQTIYFSPREWWTVVCALVLCMREYARLADLFRRLLRQGKESPLRRAKALLHTWLGAYWAVRLRNYDVEHIHAHHGYFSAWAAMVAARLLGISYSMTLHGSDLLIDGAYLDLKLENCSACFTISEYNREHIRKKFPEIDQRKIVLRRLGVCARRSGVPCGEEIRVENCFALLSVGRLHKVKNHAFLLEACAVLQNRGLNFLCLIAGDGPERERLTQQIRRAGLQGQVKLLGQVQRRELEELYAACDLVVLTSRSEGIPLVLMEAMAQGKPVLAPNISGIPELVVEGKTGFLYEPGSLANFVARVEFIRNSRRALGPLRQAAREHVLTYFHREANLQAFVDELLQRIPGDGGICHENPVLQQI